MQCAGVGYSGIVEIQNVSGKCGADVDLRCVICYNLIKRTTEIFMAIIVNPPTIDTVVPNARKKHKIFGIAVYCCIALIAASFISFAAVGIATVTTMGKINMFFAMIPFFGFVLGGALLSVFSTKRARLAGLVNLLDRVESSDYSVLVSLSPVAEAAYMTRTAETVKKCVAQGLLPDYEIVADVVVAKKSIAMSDADAKTAYDDYIALAMPNAAYVDMVRDESKPAFCPSCGAPTGDGNGKFCQYCGAKLRSE